MFYTHWELGQLQRLTFGINSTQGVFHEEIKQTLADIPNVKNIYDDISIARHNQAENDLVLCQILQYPADCGITLNLPKWVFNKPRINFFGIIFSQNGLAPATEKIQALLQATQPQSVAEVRSFLDMIKLSLHFIPASLPSQPRCENS